MFFFFEPCACYACTEVFIFLILLGESCIMKECSELEIFEVFSIDSLCHREIGRTGEYSLGMGRVMIWIVSTFLEEIAGIGFCLFYKCHIVLGLYDIGIERCMLLYT